MEPGGSGGPVGQSFVSHIYNMSFRSSKQKYQNHVQNKPQTTEERATEESELHMQRDVNPPHRVPKLTIKRSNMTTQKKVKIHP